MNIEEYKKKLKSASTVDACNKILTALQEVEQSDEVAALIADCNNQIDSLDFIDKQCLSKRKRKSVLVPPQAQDEITSMPSKKKKKEKPKKSDLLFKVGDVLGIKDKFKEKVDPRWSGARINEITEEKIIFDPNESWDLVHFKQFQHVFFTAPSKSNTAKPSLSMNVVSSSMPSEEMRLGTFSDSKTPTKEETPKAKKWSHRMRDSVRKAKILTAETCTKNLIHSTEPEFMKYLEVLIKESGWQSIVITSLVDYHLIYDFQKRAKTSGERQKDKQKPMKMNNLIAVLKKMDVPFLVGEKIEAYNKEISVMDLLCLTESSEVIQAVIHQLCIKDVPKNALWMHFAMSNQNGIHIALELSRSFPNASWRVDGEPPALYYYWIEQKHWKEIPNRFDEFLSIIMSEEVFSYEIASLKTPLFIAFIQSVAFSCVQDVVKEVIKGKFDKKWLVNQWNPMVENHFNNDSCTPENCLNAYVFMTELLIEMDTLTKKDVHDLALKNPEAKETTCQIEQVETFLNHFSPETLNKFITHNNLDKDEKKFVWFVDSKIETSFPSLEILKTKAVPAYCITEEVEQLNQMLMLYKHNGKTASFFHKWVRSIRVPSKYANQAMANSPRMSVNYKRENIYAKDWVQDFGSSMGFSIPENINSETEKMDFFRKKYVNNGMRLFLDKREGKEENQLFRKAQVQIKIKEMQCLDNGNILLKLKVAFRIDGLMKNHNYGDVTVAGTIENIRGQIIHFLRKQIKRRVLALFRENNIECSDDFVISDDCNCELTTTSGEKVSFELSSVKRRIGSFIKERNKKKMETILSDINKSFKEGGVDLEVQWNSVGSSNPNPDTQRLDFYSGEQRGVGFEYHENEETEKNINLFRDLIKRMVALKYTKDQIQGHAFFPLERKNKPGFEWVELKFQSEFMIHACWGTGNVTTTNIPNVLNGLRSERTVVFKPSISYPISGKSTANCDGVGLSCGHFFAKEVAMMVTVSYWDGSSYVQEDRHSRAKIQAMDIPLGDFMAIDSSELKNSMKDGTLQFKRNWKNFHTGSVIKKVQGMEVTSLEGFKNAGRSCRTCQRVVFPNRHVDTNSMTNEVFAFFPKGNLTLGESKWNMSNKTVEYCAPEIEERSTNKEIHVISVDSDAESVADEPKKEIEISDAEVDNSDMIWSDIFDRGEDALLGSSSNAINLMID